MASSSASVARSAAHTEPRKHRPVVSSKGRVLVAMSGGIDSSLSALLLHEQGYEVIGLTMKTWDYARVGHQGKEMGCCSLDAIHDARELALSIGVPHYVTDIREAFGKDVMDYFTAEYLAGRTPNPCVMCNTHIKWEVLLSKADALDCDYVATGHYVSLRKEQGRYLLSRARDRAKDQSYALWGVSQRALSRTLFPMATYTKTEIKTMAHKRGLSVLANKPESYEICFIPEGNYRDFLRKEVKDLDKRIGPGDFVNTAGQVIGRHQGYPYYTIGQRRGLGLALGHPVYVVALEPDANRVVVGTEADLRRHSMRVRGLNWVKYEAPPTPCAAQVHIRYNDKQGRPAKLKPIGTDCLEVYFGIAATAVTPGQAAVFYENEDLMGGGWIESAP